MNIESSDWAKLFKKNAPLQWAEALEYAKRDHLHVKVELRHDRNRPMWGIVVDDDSDFWMGAFDYQEDAINMCETMGWKRVDQEAPDRT